MIFFTPAIVKYEKKNLDITKLHHSKQISPVPWPFVIVRFHCIRYMSTHTCWQPSWNERVRFILTVSLHIWWQWQVPSSHGRMKNINNASSCSVQSRLRFCIFDAEYSIQTQNEIIVESYWCKKKLPRVLVLLKQQPITKVNLKIGVLTSLKWGCLRNDCHFTLCAYE